MSWRGIGPRTACNLACVSRGIIQGTNDDVPWSMRILTSVLSAGRFGPGGCEDVMAREVKNWRVATRVKGVVFVAVRKRDCISRVRFMSGFESVVSVRLAAELGRGAMCHTAWVAPI